MQSVTQNCRTGFLQKLSLRVREGGIALLSLKKYKEKQIQKPQRNSSLLDLIFNTYSTRRVSVTAEFCT